MQFLDKIREQFRAFVAQHGLAEEKVQVLSARPLSPHEAIGRPDRQDFPLLKGKEAMLEATFRGAPGQAYTDMPGNYTGTLGEVLALPLADNFQRAVFVASLNAVLRHLGLVDRTVHCRDQEPGQCAAQLVQYVRERYGQPKIAFIGLQPAMVEALAPRFPLRVTDLDPDNIGRQKCGVMIEGADRTQEAIAWADLVLATGTTAVNNTLAPLLGPKPVLFYGVTIAGVAYLEGYERICFCGH